MFEGKIIFPIKNGINYFGKNFDQNKQGG